MKSLALSVALGLAAPAAHASAESITDAQIASIVVTANQVDVDAGRAAAAKTTNAEVKKFAQLMVTDHTGVNKSATELVTRLKVTPEDNETSQALKEGGATNLKTLSALSGAAFRRTTMRSRITSRCSLPSTRRSSRARRMRS